MRLALLASMAAGLMLAACDAGATEDSASVIEEAPAVSTVDATQLEALQAGGNIRLIDVRTDEEVAEVMIPGAEQIVLDKFDPAALDMSDGREVVLYCRSGRRSGIAAERLAEFTGKPALHLEGGITAWVEAGNPTTRPD